jgi:caa(3)-type oxidase subunit IV
MILVRSRATAVWLVLLCGTLVSAALGARHGAGALILLFAFMKAYLVGLYFMELRDAPPILRLMFTGYCGLVFAAVVIFYLESP